MLKVFVCAAIFTGMALPSAVASNANLQQGQILYNEHCSGCHLRDGAGGIKMDHSVSADLRAPGLEETYRQSTVLLSRAILQARDEDGERLDQPMPAWQGRLSQQQVLDIIAYLKTLK